jgi:hypothetical protein
MAEEPAADFGELSRTEPLGFVPARRAVCFLCS